MFKHYFTSLLLPLLAAPVFGLDWTTDLEAARAKAQAEGIAAAKAKGVKFGRPPLPLPDNFYEVHKAWRTKKLTLKQAAAACNMPVGTFYGKARKFENVD